MRSKGEERVYKALAALGNYRVKEQYQVGDRLRLDFYIQDLGVGIEVDGSQHETFNAHFYDSKDAFKDAQARDRKKEDLCKEAGITLIRLDYPIIMRSPSAQALSEVILAQVKSAREAGREEETEDDW